MRTACGCIAWAASLVAGASPCITGGSRQGVWAVTALQGSILARGSALSLSPWLALGLLAPAQTASAAATVGSPAPPVEPLEWINTDGNLSWRSLRGRVILIDKRVTWCGPCVKSIPHRNELLHLTGGKRHDGTRARQVAEKQLAQATKKP